MKSYPRFWSSSINGRCRTAALCYQDEHELMNCCCWTLEDQFAASVSQWEAIASIAASTVDGQIFDDWQIVFVLVINDRVDDQMSR